MPTDSCPSVLDFKLPFTKNNCDDEIKEKLTFPPPSICTLRNRCGTYLARCLFLKPLPHVTYMMLSQIGSLRSLLFLVLAIVSRIVIDGRYQFWKETTFEQWSCFGDVSGSQPCLAKDPYSGPSAPTHLTLRICIKKILGNSKRIRKISKIELSWFRILLI